MLKKANIEDKVVLRRRYARVYLWWVGFALFTGLFDAVMYADGGTAAWVYAMPPLFYVVITSGWWAARYLDDTKEVTKKYD